MSLISASLILIFISLIIGYLFGSINFAIIISKTKNSNITQLGSKNAGTTNALRVLGKKYGILVLFGDIIKVIIPTLIIFFIFRFTKFYVIINKSNNSFYMGYLVYLTPFACIIGHIFPIYFKFKGGKGVASYFGFTIMLSPWIALIWIIVGSIIYKTKKIVSLLSIVLVVATPFLLLIPGINWVYFMMPNITKFNDFLAMINKYMINMSFIIVISIISSILVIYKHKQNLYNLFYKKEQQLIVNKDNNDKQ